MDELVNDSPKSKPDDKVIEDEVEDFPDTQVENTIEDDNGETVKDANSTPPALEMQALQEEKEEKE